MNRTHKIYHNLMGYVWCQYVIVFGMKCCLIFSWLVLDTACIFTVFDNRTYPAYACPRNGHTCWKLMCRIWHELEVRASTWNRYVFLPLLFLLLLQPCKHNEREIYINHKLEQCHENLFALNGAVEHEWWAFPNFTLFGNKYGFSIFNENLFIPGRVHDATEITTDKCLDDN